MSCDHCGMPVPPTEYYIEITWCKSCINKDWDLLDEAGASLPDDCFVKKFEFPAFHWMAGASADAVKTIPKITQRCFPDTTEEVCTSAPEIKKTSIPDPCKLSYYGIECQCGDCALRAYANVSLKKASIFCKKIYYGIECDGDCCKSPEAPFDPFQLDLTAWRK